MKFNPLLILFQTHPGLIFTFFDLLSSLSHFSFLYVLASPHNWIIDSFKQIIVFNWSKQHTEKIGFFLPISDYPTIFLDFFFRIKVTPELAQKRFSYTNRSPNHIKPINILTYNVQVFPKKYSACFVIRTTMRNKALAFKSLFAPFIRLLNPLINLTQLEASCWRR